MKRFAAIAVALTLAAAFAAGGCGGPEDPAAMLDRCLSAAGGYARGGGYLHFLQEAEYLLDTPRGEFEQVVRVEGDIIFPHREAYEYRETAGGTIQPGEGQENSFSYLTVDGGKTAFVAGERLAAELGVSGWVRYVPPPGQDRYFSYPGLLEGLTTTGEEPEWLGYEDLEGERCGHIRYTVAGRDLIDMRLRENPEFAEQYGGVDLSSIVGELRVEMWIREEDDLPARISIEQSMSMEDGTNISNRLLFAFSGYGEEPRLLIEEPAAFREAV